MQYLNLGDAIWSIQNSLEASFQYDVQRTPPAIYTTRITTPLLYPDGDHIEVWMRSLNSEEGTYYLSDEGETMGWLLMNGIKLEDMNELDDSIRDVCLTFGVDFEAGEFKRQLPEKDVGWPVVALAQTMSLVASLGKYSTARSDVVA